MMLKEDNGKANCTNWDVLIALSPFFFHHPAAVVALLLTIIQKCPWGVDNLLAIKRVIIVSFPAAMSGTLSDMIRFGTLGLRSCRAE